MPDFGRWSANGGDPSLNEINRTDRFLDALAFEQPVYSTDPGEAELAQLLSGWRDDVRDAPLTAALTPRDAVVALDRATTSRRRNRTSLALVGSVAAAVLCLGGFGAVVAGAGPGDALYGLRTMLFGDEHQVPRDDAVVLAAQTQMAEVQQLIEQGQWDAAQDKLQTLTTTVATVNDVERKQELVSQWQELTVKVDAQDPAATVPPGVPPPVFPDVPVIVLDTTTSTTTSSETTTTSPSETTTTSPSSTPLPTPSTTPPILLLPTPPPATQTPLPTPLPTPSPVTPLPTPSAVTPLPTPSAVTPLPTPSAVTPLPTPTGTVAIPTKVPVPVPTPTAAPSQVEQQEETAEEPQIRQAPPPRVVTTTVVVPEGPKAPDEPR